MLRDELFELTNSKTNTCQNSLLQVGQMNAMSGKEELVFKGLDATRRSIDDFLVYFPKAEIDAVSSRIKEENELNAKEFDSTFGVILNMPPPS
jgi:hypothetical protein